MKKFTFLFCLFLMNLAIFNLQAQEAPKADSTKNWKTSGSAGFNITNVGLSNWAAGGVNSLSLGTLLHGEAKRETKVSQWINTFDFAYGLLKQGGSSAPFKKTDDAIRLASQYNRKLNEKWSLAAGVEFRTQVADGYKYSADPNNAGQELKERISTFMAPGYLTPSLGIGYQKGEIFSATLSPITGKFTFVVDDSLSAMGAFGVEKGQKSRGEFGANLICNAKIKLAENINFRSTLNLFGNYARLKTIDVAWETQLVMKVNKYINTTFGTNLLYDDDINIIRTKDGSVGPATQFKHVLTIGVLFNFQ